MTHFSCDRLGTRLSPYSRLGSGAGATRLLIARGAPINMRAENGGGMTPLHVAARQGEDEVIELLVRRRTDAGHHAVATFLRQHGAK